MSELDEFAEALMDQISVEINEEKEIAGLSKRINEDRNFTIEFENDTTMTIQWYGDKEKLLFKRILWEPNI